MAQDGSFVVNAPLLPSDSKKGYSVMAFKSGFALVDNDRRLIKDHVHQVREALFACTTQVQVECAVAFARFLNYAGLNSDNYWLFMRLIMTNNQWVIDELLHDRDPRLLFSTIRPDEDLIEAAFQALFSRHPEEIYSPALEAMLGVIQNSYFDPDDGYRIRKLSIMDINTLGKFLLKAESQEHPVNRLVLDILDRLAQVGGYYGEPDKNVLSKHAFNVRYAYFDRTRNLIDAIPEPLLVRFPDNREVHPEDDYAELVAKRRLRKRDSHGRFIKERLVAGPEQDKPQESDTPDKTQALSPETSLSQAPASIPDTPSSKKEAAAKKKMTRAKKPGKEAAAKEPGLPKKVK